MVAIGLLQSPPLGLCSNDFAALYVSSSLSPLLLFFSSSLSFFLQLHVSVFGLDFIAHSTLPFFRLLLRVTAAMTAVGEAATLTQPRPEVTAVAVMWSVNLP